MAAFLLKLFLLGLGTSSSHRGVTGGGGGCWHRLHPREQLSVYRMARRIVRNGAVLLLVMAASSSHPTPPAPSPAHLAGPAASGPVPAAYSTPPLPTGPAPPVTAVGPSAALSVAPAGKSRRVHPSAAVTAPGLYDVSLVDGYNVGIGGCARLRGGRGGSCRYAGCVDVNARCPAELRVASESGDDGVPSAVIRRHLPSPSPS
ncbi:unnamed protein product, partial [Musa acuminata subsp. burmannicoides]